MKLTEITSDIDAICKEYGIKNYTINNDGSIDVTGNADMSWFNIRNFPVTFGRVTGNFDCSGNRLLNTLKNVPHTVDGDFSCGNCPTVSKLIRVKEINGKLNLFTTPITNLLYVLKIKGLKEVHTGNDEISKILNKHLLGDRDIMECQEELIEAGFGDWAKLK